MKPIMENSEPTVPGTPEGETPIKEDICQHQKVRYSLLYQSVVCDDCKRTWRDEWGPIELKPTFQIQMQLPPDIEMLVRMMKTHLPGNNGLYS